ncbi:HepT-like ribonuclease domain-containing protein [Rhodoferax sp.]
MAFRNQLIHGYPTVKARTVWNVAHSSLPALLVCVNALLDELGEG